MTCASCTVRIEKELNRLAGVEAAVNSATEKARLNVPDDLSTDDAIATVVATGYTASVPAASPHEHATDGGRGVAVPPATGGAEATEASQWRQRLLVSTVLTVPVVL